MRSVFALLQGNLSEFVKIRPEARAYYELGSASLKFILPKPGFLDGIQGREVRGMYCQPQKALHLALQTAVDLVLSLRTLHMRRDLLYL